MTKTSKRRSGFPTESPIWYWQWVALLIEALDPATLLFMWRAQYDMYDAGAAWVYPAKGDLVVGCPTWRRGCNSRGAYTNYSNLQRDRTVKYCDIQVK